MYSKKFLMKDLYKLIKIKTNVVQALQGIFGPLESYLDVYQNLPVDTYCLTKLV